MNKILIRQGRYTTLLLECVLNYCLRTLEYRKEYDRDLTLTIVYVHLSTVKSTIESMIKILLNLLNN